MSKWSIITRDGEFRPVSPECDVENLLADPFRPRLIRRLVVHAVLCMTDSPCGQVYATPAEAGNAVTEYVGGPVQGVPEPPAVPNPWAWCTCSGGRMGLNPAEFTPPDFFCARHYPENHRTRELQAADGYTRRARAIAPHLELPTWQALPASGKEMWRTWAECEMWTEDLG